MTQWIDLVTEQTLEPDLPICDPHHHLWDQGGSRYLLDEVLKDIQSGHNVIRTVFVECSSMYRATGPEALKPVGETEFVQGIAAMSASGGFGSCRVADGIVSFADLTLGSAVEEVLVAHGASSSNRFKGIRHAASWHPDAAIRNAHTQPPQGLMANPSFREGFTVLARLGLTFDAWFYHHQLPEFVDLARAFPETTIILDHFGGPLGIGRYEKQNLEVFNDWRTAISELGNCPNVYFKLGGINMKINGFGWHLRDLPPDSDELLAATRHYYEYCIETFGAQRCMFESNFPVDKASCSYNVLWNMFKKLTVDCSDTERAALFHDTAARAYSLGGEVV